MTFSAVVAEGWRSATRKMKSRPPSPERTYTYASGWRPCLRAMCLDLLHPEDTSFGDESLERFRDGDGYEDLSVIHLKFAGQRSDPRFKVEGEQERFVLRDREGHVVIVGKIDCKLRFDNEREAFPYDIKAGESVRAIRTIEDLQTSRWTKSILPQILIYCFGLGVQRGGLILNRPGFPLVLDVQLDDAGLEIAEDFLERATVAAAVKRGEQELPGYHSDPSACLICDHRGKSCVPDINSGEGLKLINNEELTQLGRTMVENKKAASEHRRAKEKLSQALRGIPLVSLSGQFIVTGKSGKKTTYKVPVEIKDKYRIVDPNGTWKMDIEELPEAD